MGVDLTAYTFEQFNEQLSDYGWNLQDLDLTNQISEDKFEVFKSMVEERAPHLTPDHISRQCVVALANYVFPLAERGAEYAGTPNLAGAWLYSGCGVMVKPYRRIRMRSPRDAQSL